MPAYQFLELKGLDAMAEFKWTEDYEEGMKLAGARILYALRGSFKSLIPKNH